MSKILDSDKLKFVKNNKQVFEPVVVRKMPKRSPLKTPPSASVTVIPMPNKTKMRSPVLLSKVKKIKVSMSSSSTSSSTSSTSSEEEVIQKKQKRKTKK